MATSVRHLQSLGALLCGVILSIGAFNAQSSEAATYYVATTGSDSNTCMSLRAASGALSTGSSKYISLTIRT